MANKISNYTLILIEKNGNKSILKNVQLFYSADLESTWNLIEENAFFNFDKNLFKMIYKNKEYFFFNVRSLITVFDKKIFLNLKITKKFYESNRKKFTKQKAKVNFDFNENFYLQKFLYDSTNNKEYLLEKTQFERKKFIDTMIKNFNLVEIDRLENEEV
ncbi:MSC_0621 family F1-like ATPase epsilon subunit [Candidatus Mycoplasma pogonae]